MENFKNITDELINIFQSFASIIGPFFFKIALVVVLVIIGWVAGKMLKMFIKKIVIKTDLDVLLRKMELESLLEKMGYRLNSGNFLGDVARWLVFLGFFIVSLNILGLSEVTEFMVLVLGSVMNIIIAIIIFALAVFVARFVKKLTEGTASAMKVKTGNFMGNIAAGIVYFSALVTVLGLFEVTQVILQFVGIIVAGIITALALAFGLAFGLGGKERAAEIIEDMKK
jgi:hypothetical protein